MKTDYKIWYVLRDPRGNIVEASVRFYEGELQEIGEDTVYVRTTRLQGNDLTHLGERKIIKDGKGHDAVVYQTRDFGRINTEEALITFLNGEIIKDQTREVIDEQK